MSKRPAAITGADAALPDDEQLQSVYDVLVKAAGRWQQSPILRVLPATAATYRVNAGDTSFGHLLERVNLLAEQLQAAGFRRGDRVLLLLENRPMFFTCWLALNRLGLSAVPVNADLRADELRYLIEHSEPALAISIESHATLLVTAASAAAVELPIAVITATDSATADDANTDPSGITSQPASGHSAASTALFNGDLPKRLAIANDNATGAANQPITRATEAALLYTSGTTGKPKGCVLSNLYFLLAGHWYANAGGLCTLHINRERMITPLPLYHMNALAYSFMAMLNTGGCLISVDRFHPSSWWHDVRTSGATCLHYLGVMPAMLMQALPEDNDLQRSIRFGFGAGIDPTLQHGFESRFGFPLVEAWAMTETGAGAVVAANHEPRRLAERNFGTPHHDLDFKVVDEHGNPVAQGAPGELLVRHIGKPNEPRYGFFSHYLKDPEATATAWASGWFHTGDAVRQNPDGSLCFVDRLRNVIRRSGENIAAVEVEATLQRHPRIAAVGVSAVADAMRGDEVFAVVVLAADTDRPPADDAYPEWYQQQADEICSWCRDRLAYFKVPGYIAFVDALPVTSTQKLQRGELRALAAHCLQSGQCYNTTHLKQRQLPA